MKGNWGKSLGFKYEDREGEATLHSGLCSQLGLNIEALCVDPVYSAVPLVIAPRVKLYSHY